MKVENAVYPNKQQMEGFLEQTEEGPIFMVNLLKFKEKAVYQDGRETDLSGEEAYGLYATGVGALLKEFGGGIVFNGAVSRLALGEVEEMWDSIAIAEYPSRAAMLEMMMSEKMQEISEHRAAGLEGQLNIETTASEAEQFGK